jgi:hypothetical protein
LQSTSKNLKFAPNLNVTALQTTMNFPNIFTKEISDGIVDRINKLSFDTKPLWGKMTVEQMLAHCSVTYEMIYENKHAKPGFLMKIMLNAFVKKTVVGMAPYRKNSQTAPAFLIKDSRNFEIEKKRLIQYIQKTQQLGEKEFNQKESHSFGKLSADEWNTMFYKHLDHHLSQFGV